MILAVIITNHLVEHQHHKQIDKLCEAKSLPLVILDRKALNRVYGPTLAPLLGPHADVAKTKTNGATATDDSEITGSNGNSPKL